MTRLPVDGVLVSVTLLQMPDQYVVRYKTQEKDGYDAVVVASGKKELNKKKGQKVKYAKMVEFSYSEEFKTLNGEGIVLTPGVLEWVTHVNVTGTSKGKGFAGVMKRHHAKGGPKTHGSKFHRHIGSLGNRKPRRVMKWHPHHGHMGAERTTLKNIRVIDVIQLESETLIVVKGSVPGGYNSYLTLELV